MMFSREEKIAHINKSPESVKIHDKEKWLSIFSEYAIVEDPVGSKPHTTGLYDKKSRKRGNAKLSSFYETFIAPNTIVFDVKNDIVCKDHVVRDLTVNIDMQGVPVSVPMHLLYELVEEKDQLKIRRLAAHWELMPMMGLLMSKGLTVLPVLTSMSARMMKHQGLLGAIGFTSGIGKLGNQGKETVNMFLAAFNAKNQSSLSNLFCDDAAIRAPYGEIETTPSKIFSAIRGTLSFSKLLLAGNTVTTTVTYKAEKQCDQKNDINKQGVAIFEFDCDSKKINHLNFYYE